MTHSYQTSIYKSRKAMSNSFYQAEVQDFDNEYYEFEVSATSFEDANSQVASLAAAQGIDIYNINIYKF